MYRQTFRNLLLEVDGKFSRFRLTTNSILNMRNAINLHYNQLYFELTLQKYILPLKDASIVKYFLGKS